jgi:hypothetical protein
MRLQSFSVTAIGNLRGYYEIPQIEINGKMNPFIETEQSKRVT